MANPKQPQQQPWEQIEGGVGASDANNGGGAGAGVPDGETGLREEGAPALKGNVEEDREKLFPERFAKNTNPDAGQADVPAGDVGPAD